MTQSLAIPRVIPEDWKRLDLIINKIKMRLGSAGSPTFAELTLTGLTASTLIGANASKVLESVTVGTGLDYTRPNLTLSHLGIEALTDPGVDKILFWDDSATACKWLGVGNSIAITDVTIDTIQDIRITAWPLFVNTNTALSSMILTGGAISAGTNAGTIKVAALTAMLRTGAGATDPLVKITLAEQDNITLAAADTFYNVLLTYGDPCTIATSTNSGNGANIIGIGHCLKEGDGTRHYADAGLRLSDGVRKLHQRASKLRRLEKSFGVLVSETGARNLYLTAGTFHRGINSYAFALKDTSASDTFDYYYYNPNTSAWVKDDNGGSHYTQIDIVQYNKVDAGTGLDNLVANKYTTNWVFVHPDDEHILVVYGRSNSTLTAAENENIPPSLPDILGKMAVLLCKIIVRATTGALIFQNVEYFIFTPDITVDHNELQGLQGGTADEYYHFTVAEHTLISAIGGLTPTDGNFIVGNGTTWVAESDATVRTSLGLGTGDSPQFTGIELGHATDTTITRVSAGVIAVEGTTVMLVGGAPTAHYHDGDTLQHDGINSDAGGGFSFTTAGAVTFSESITMSAGKDLTIAGHIVFNTNNSYIGFVNPRITFNDDSNYLEITGNMVVSDDFTIGLLDAVPRILFDDTQGDIVIGGDLLVNAGSLKSGIADTTRGYLYLYGGATGFGGSAYFEVPANSDGVINSYIITPYEDDLRIGTDVDGDIINIIAGSDVTITTTLGVTGAITASNYTAANLLTACATSAGGLDFSSVVTLTVAETETTINYHTDARAATWLAANHETTYTHTDIALNTTHRGLVAGNPHVVTPTELGLVIGTNVQAHGDVLDDLNTLGANAADSEFLVGTAAGTLAWENAATAKVSIGLGNVENTQLSTWAGSANITTLGTITTMLNIQVPENGGMEVLQNWALSDVAGASVKLFSNTIAVSRFDPAFIGTQSVNAGASPLIFIGDAKGTDSGDVPIVVFQGRNSDAGDDRLTTRPILSFANYDIRLMTLLANGNIGFGIATPLAGTNNSGMQIDRGGHTTLLLGDGTTDGGFIQSSDNKQRMFIGANIYDDASTSWVIPTEANGYVAFDLISETTTAGIARILVGSPNDTAYGTDNISLEAYKSNTLSYLALDPNNEGFNVHIGGKSPKTKLTVEGALTLKERAAADGDTAAYGQIWVDNSAPCRLRFTNDIGGDFYTVVSDAGTGGTDSAGAGKQYVEMEIAGSVYKVLHDGTV